MISTHFGAAQPCFGPEICRIIQFRRKVSINHNGTSQHIVCIKNISKNVYAMLSVVRTRSPLTPCCSTLAARR